MEKIRLDQFLTQHHPQYSRMQIKKLIEGGFVLVDGEKKKPSFLLRGGEDIEIKRRAPEIPKAVPEKLPLDILYEDDDMIVIHKAAGMVVHPAPGNINGTLVSAILHHLGEGWCQGEGVRPGIVHRLDKGTSGVMVIAKTEFTLRHIALQFKNRTVEKVYQALVFGEFDQKQGTINFAIGRDTQHRRKISSKTRWAREASTSYEVKKQYQHLALMELRPKTGRTHQIRVHLSEKHHPVVGDTLYGAKSYLSRIKDEELLKRLEEVDRPLLHAAELSIDHPVTGKRLQFKAPLAEDFRLVLNHLA